MPRSKTGLFAAFVVGALVVSGPQIAIAAFDAVNSDKVDGKHAVGAGATVAGRAGKLVATNANGRLPSNIIVKAPDANLLDGVNSTAFQRRVTGSCPAGTAVTAVGADGSLACAPDNVDGGDAETLDGLSSAAFADTLGATVVAVRGDGTAGENGTALRNALAAITDATAQRPYLLQLAPGTYDLGTASFLMKDHVSIAGAGRTATDLTSARAGSNAVGALNLANGAELSHLTVTISHSTASATGVASGAGVTARVSDVRVNYLAPGIALLAMGAAANVDVVDSHFRVESATTSLSTGPFAYNNAKLTLRGSSVVLQSPSSANEGALAAQAGATLEMFDGSITSTGRVARLYSGAVATIRMANTRLDGTTTGIGSGTVTCFNTFDEAFTAATCSS